jgi:hypothetical protein
MRKIIFAGLITALSSIVLLLQFSCAGEGTAKPLNKEEMVALGKYIVTTSGCDDCHTPKIFTENGPVFDTTRRFSGYPEEEVLPAIDLNMIGLDKWSATEKHLGAWVGPWGISYASNLTPDKATGIGTMTEEMFIKTIREGKYMGVGRPLLPPMPWQVYGMKTDQDLKAMYAYLMSVKPINNMVPQPVTPDKMGQVLAKK